MGPLLPLGSSIWSGSQDDCSEAQWFHCDGHRGMLGGRRLHVRWLLLLTDNFRLGSLPIVYVIAMLSATLLFRAGFYHC